MVVLIPINLVSNSQNNQFCKNDLDLDPMTLVLKFNYDVPKIKFLYQGIKVLARTDKRTDTDTQTV